MTYTKETIQEKIVNDLNWTIRSIEVLFSRQTQDEQRSGETTHLNGRGFNGRDSVIMTSFFNQIQKRKQYNNPVLLSDKQLNVCRRVLPKYWRQIQEEIQIKQGND